MSPQEKHRFDILFNMVETEGWKQLCSDLQNDLNVQNSVFATKDEADLNFRKGAMTVMLNLLNLEENLKAQYDQLTEESEEA